jgi:flagellar protein FliJ
VLLSDPYAIKIQDSRLRTTAHVGARLSLAPPRQPQTRPRPAATKRADRAAVGRVSKATAPRSSGADHRSVRQNFTFGLERVRELREHTESQAKEQLASSLNQRVRGAAMLAAASDELASAAQAGRPQEGAQQNAADLVAHERWMQALRRDEEAAALSLDRLDAEVDARRSALGDASREREVLERLKQRRQAEHKAELGRRESATLDELALQMHVRRAGGSR